LAQLWPCLSARRASWRRRRRWCTGAGHLFRSRFRWSDRLRCAAPGRLLGPGCSNDGRRRRRRRLVLVFSPGRRLYEPGARGQVHQRDLPPLGVVIRLLARKAPNRDACEFDWKPCAAFIGTLLIICKGRSMRFRRLRFKLGNLSSLLVQPRLRGFRCGWASFAARSRRCR
jgi:hypothetical protein